MINHKTAPGISFMGLSGASGNSSYIVYYRATKANALFSKLSDEMKLGGGASATFS